MRLPSSLIRLLTGALLVATAVTCQNFAYFDLDHEGTSALAAGDMPTTLAVEGLTDVNLGTHPSMKIQGLGPEDVTYAALAGATLGLSSPPTGQDLSFMQTIELHIAADGLEEKVIATAEAPPPGVNLVPLVPVTDAITAYFDRKQPTFTVHGTYRGAAPTAMVVTTHLSLQVRVGEPHGTCQR